MSMEEFKNLISSDLYRYRGKVSLKNFFKSYISHPGFRYTFYMRLSDCFRTNIFTKYSLYYISILFLRHYKYKYVIDIPYTTKIGEGFYIGHFGGIVVNGNSKIGKNCNISHGVTLGQSNRGDKIGCPTLGDNVYIAPGVKIIGNLKIGNNVAIGANAVVTKDIPDNAVAVGIPAKVISYDGSVGYINRTDYK